MGQGKIDHLQFKQVPRPLWLIRASTATGYRLKAKNSIPRDGVALDFLDPGSLPLPSSLLDNRSSFNHYYLLLLTTSYPPALLHSCAPALIPCTAGVTSPPCTASSAFDASSALLLLSGQSRPQPLQSNTRYLNRLASSLASILGLRFHGARIAATAPSFIHPRAHS